MTPVVARARLFSNNSGFCSHISLSNLLLCSRCYYYIMETILSKESLDWFDKSRRQMQLFHSFFIARMKFEQKLELQWTKFSTKWRTKFEDAFKETTTSSTFAEQTMYSIFTVLVKEPMDNARICGTVVSLLEQKRQSPDAFLKRWLADPVGNTTCYQIDQFKSAFNATVTNLAKSEETVENAKEVLQETTVAFGKQKVDRPNKKKTKTDPKEELFMARQSYTRAVQDLKKMKEPFIKEVTYLHQCLDSYEHNRLTVLKNALDVYQTAVNEYEKQRESRKARIEEMKECFKFSVEQSVKEWLDSVQQPFHFPDFPNDPFPVNKHGKKSNDLEVMDFDPEVAADKSKDGAEISSEEESVLVATKRVQTRNDIPKTSGSDDGSDGVEFKKTQGQKILQQKPANEDGLAYGYIVTGKYSRQKLYGFFPANMVAVNMQSQKRMNDFFKKK